MALRSTVVTVGTTATPLAPGSDQDGNPTYRDLALYNGSGVTVYVGGSGVTTANGFPIPASGTLSLDSRDAAGQVYAIVATGTASVNVLEVGV